MRSTHEWIKNPLLIFLVIKEKNKKEAEKTYYGIITENDTYKHIQV